MEQAAIVEDGEISIVEDDGEFWILLNPANLATTAPSALGTAAAGTSNLAARQDHVHAMPANLLPYSAPATSGNGNRVLGLNSSATALEWKDLPASSNLDD